MVLSIYTVFIFIITSPYDWYKFGSSLSIHVYLFTCPSFPFLSVFLLFYYLLFFHFYSSIYFPPFCILPLCKYINMSILLVKLNNAKLKLKLLLFDQFKTLRLSRNIWKFLYSAVTCDTMQWQRVICSLCYHMYVCVYCLTW